MDTLVSTPYIVHIHCVILNNKCVMKTPYIVYIHHEIPRYIHCIHTKHTYMDGKTDRQMNQ